VVAVQGQGGLFEVVDALHSSGRLAGRLHSRQQERDEDADDGDDHKEFDEGEACRVAIRDS
jgi:hypothetical protein